MNAQYIWIGQVKPQRFSPIKKELSRTLNAGERFVRVQFKFDVCGVVLGLSNSVLMDSGEWMPVEIVHTRLGVLIGPRDLQGAAYTQYDEVWHGAIADRIASTVLFG